MLSHTNYCNKLAVSTEARTR